MYRGSNISRYVAVVSIALFPPALTASVGNDENTTRYSITANARAVDDGGNNVAITWVAAETTCTLTTTQILTTTSTPSLARHLSWWLSTLTTQQQAYLVTHCPLLALLM